MKKFRQIVKVLESVNRNRNKLSVFLIFVLVSTILWLLIKLSDEYTVGVSLPLYYDEIPSNKTLVEKTDEYLNFTVTSRGFVIFKTIYLTNNREILIPLDQIPYRKRNSVEYYINTSNLREWLARKFKINDSEIAFDDTEIRFRLEELYSKKIKVIPNLSLSFKDQYQQYSESQTDPDSITVFGTAMVIDTMNSIFTHHLNLQDIDQTIRVRLPLVYSPELISISPEEIELVVEVERFTETTFILPVKQPELQTSLKIFPEQVTAKFLVSLKDYANLSNSDFKILLDTNGLHQNKPTLSLTVAHQPKKIKNLTISPDFVEYIRTRP